MANTGKGLKKAQGNSGGSRKSVRQTKKFAAIGKYQEIKWIDHNSYSGGWIHPHEATVLTTCTSVGRVQYEDDKYVQICTNFNDHDDKIGVVMNIVKSCITKRRTLK